MAHTTPTPGTHIWYELLTTDAPGARRFYEQVVPHWQIDEHPMPSSPGQEYRMVNTRAGHAVAGVFTLDKAMCDQGARPCWMAYIGVDDVDKAVAAIVADGGRCNLPAFDIPNVGRIAMLSDPQGGNFYVMRGNSDEGSVSYQPGSQGHGEWHELHATDGPSATAFYAKHFGWSKSHAMDMGPDGVYQILASGGQDFGAIYTDKQMPMPAWVYYFRCDGVEAAGKRVCDAGGQVVNGPMEVPGGDWIINALDPQGALFALVGKK